MTLGNIDVFGILTRNWTTPCILLPCVYISRDL